MGFMSLFCECIICNGFFSCSPTKVPSIIVDGERQPICEGCMRTINRSRVEKGLNPFTILRGAYEGDEE